MPDPIIITSIEEAAKVEPGQQYIVDPGLPGADDSNQQITQRLLKLRDQIIATVNTPKVEK